VNGLSKGIRKVEIALKWDPSPAGQPPSDLDIVTATYAADDPYGAPAYVVHFDSRSPDGTIYLGVNKGFCAIRPTDGTPIWCTRLSGTIRRNAAAIGADGTLYIGDRANRLWALDPNGNKKWFYAIGNDGDVNTSPAIATACSQGRGGRRC